MSPPPAAIKATFSDFRLVKGRKVAQLVFETPIEAADEALAVLGGLPRSDREAWCGIARLSIDAPSASEPKVEPPKEKRRMSELPIVQRAALLCGREAFWRYLCEHEGERVVLDEPSAASMVRAMCGVSTRSELSTNMKAALHFESIEKSFNAWLNEP